MPVHSREELVAALDANDFERLLGTPESEWLDFKKEPYLLDSDKGRWEYVKDIAAFANATGGCILIGVKATKDPNELQEKATSVTAIPKKLVNSDRYNGILLEKLYPDVQGLRMRWYPESRAVSDGLLLIEIPSQRGSSKPFVLRSMSGAEDLPVIALGVPMRVGDRTSWMRAETLHHRMQGTRQVEEAAQVERESRQHASLVQRAEEHIRTLTREMKWSNVATYFLQALPPASERTGPLLNVHGEDGLRGALARPKSLRTMGFNLRQLGSLETRNGGLAYLEDPRRCISLDRDGLFTVGAYAEADFLGWYLNRARTDASSPMRLNPLVLVEFTLEFFRFVYAALIPRVSHGVWTFRIVTEGLQSRQGGVLLNPGRHNADHWSDGAPASVDVTVHGAGRRKGELRLRAG
ncbi:ATP-binding protein [Myxococcus sp. AM011]|nr:ATP-binding protein [Myxococcus sp. AM011]NVJ28735.1 ATP-binding protein [Myxococcus sp. AM011]